MVILDETKKHLHGRERIKLMTLLDKNVINTGNEKPGRHHLNNNINQEVM